MRLTPGSSLGPYEIVEPLGAGGMGEVYRARDSRLGRDVAIKVLAPALAGGGDRLARFEREGRVLASLNHPHICTLFDVGRSNEVDYLVMEHVEGATLAERLKKGPIPLSDALRIGAEIADALDKAHTRGIVHRDLKPANVMLTRAGAKLLDFGLARTGPAAVAQLAQTGVQTADPSSGLTAAGTILGTFRYMSPEQLEGGDADARSDIWALGCVLLEMITGQPAFDGRSQASLTAAIMTGEPRPMPALRMLGAPAIEHLVSRCLAKAPDDRWQSAADLRHDIRWVSESGPAHANTRPASRLSRAASWLVLAAVAVLFALLGTGAGLRWAAGESPRSRSPVAFTIPLPPGSTWGPNHPFAVSPDGRRLVYLAARDNQRQLFVRSFDSVEATPLPGTEGAAEPFWSPDSAFVAFFADGQLKRVPVAGGPPTIVCPATQPRGGFWGDDNRIVFAATGTSGLVRVSASGGTPEPLTTIDVERGETGHRWPYVLPAGQGVLFTTLGKGNAMSIAFQRPGERTHAVLVNDGAYPQMLSPDRLVYVRAGGELFVARFDRARARADAIAPLNERPDSTGTYGDFGISLASNGTLVYLPSTRAVRSMMAVDRNGVGRPMGFPSHAYVYPRIAADGRRVAVLVDEDSSANGIWLADVERRTLTPFKKGFSGGPLWSRDGISIAYRSVRDGLDAIYSQAVDGSDEAALLYEAPPGASATPVAWLPDGQTLVFNSQDPVTLVDVLLVRPGRPEPPRQLLHGRYMEYAQGVSRDGRLLAYLANPSGVFEAFVTTLPDARQSIQVSNGGAREVIWAPSGRELFYRHGNELMSVPIESGETVRIGTARSLFSGIFASGAGPGISSYDVFPDGTFLMLKDDQPEGGATPLSVIVNWNPATKS